MDYTEQELQAVKSSYEEVENLGIWTDELASFLENVAEQIDDGEVLARVAAAIRDVGDGVA
jgi:hypothetical protein